MSPVIRIVGEPAPQGSKRAYIVPKKGARKARVNLVESSAAVKPWRAAVVAAWQAYGYELTPGPVTVAVRFIIVRPAGHWGTGRNAARLKPSAPAVPAVKPDLDKLIRSTLDGLTTAGAYEDDARVVQLSARMEYADVRGQAGGAVVEVWPWAGPTE